MSLLFYTRKILPFIVLMLFSLHVSSQYCIPTNRIPQVEPVITSVTLKDIVNSNTLSPQTDYSYSDFTSLSTPLTAGTTYTLSVTGEAYFPHNLSAWIDYNRDFEFSAAELLTTRVLGGNQPLTISITFTVPADALDGSTRLRIRAVIEPYGPWNLSNDPCLPFTQDGETEDYRVDISGGLQRDLHLGPLVSLSSGLGLGIENPAMTIRNHGSTTANGIVVNYAVDNGPVITETIPGVLAPGELITYTFNTPYDFSQPGCYTVTTWLDWGDDQIASNNAREKTVCKLSALTGTDVWYLHSNKNGGAEPLGIPPFSSTTNEVTMNTVFGAGGWQQEYFETANADSIFSRNTCLVFLDGSYDHIDPLQQFITDHLGRIENWVASGGKLFINSSKEWGASIDVNLGFGDTKLMVDETSHMGIHGPSHPVFLGPHTPVGREWNGFYAANAVVVGNSLKTIVHEKDDESFPGAPVLHLPTLAEKNWGAGIVLFGTIGASQFLTPLTESMNLRANILAYLHDCSVVSSQSDLPAPESVLSIFPNPATGSVTVSLQGMSMSEGMITVYDAMGRPVEVEKANIFFNEGFTIDLSGLPKGMYYLRVSGGKVAGAGTVLLID
ncbi:MAG: T9SS type A sorting domain-containing protein [Lewinellaceae bacterium]|nr:T9SS type A sorting domain-containing protein [Lewinellaceae bacterium]